ncbi:MAG: rhomboid family intramembrane serine protease [Chloroflexi bacterium]|nr:rhomboid family intramembrane serine protease [Chloroflexota bacterium]
MFIPIGTQEPTPLRRFPLVTTFLVVANVIVFLFEMYLLFDGGEAALDAFVTAFGVVPAAVVAGREILIPPYLTLFTSMFVHGGIAHIAFNMLYLRVFGDNVEDRLGPGRYLVFYLLAGLIAAFAQIAVDPGSAVPSVGASGAIAGVLSAYVLLFPRGIVRMFIFLGPFSRIARLPALLYIGFWFFTQFLSGIGSLGVATAETDGIAYWAHIGGFVGGLALAWLFRRL